MYSDGMPLLGETSQFADSTKLISTSREVALVHKHLILTE